MYLISRVVKLCESLNTDIAQLVRLALLDKLLQFRICHIERQVFSKHLFNLTRRYEVLVFLSSACKHIEAVLSFLHAATLVPFDSNYMLAKREVNTVAREKC